VPEKNIANKTNRSGDKKKDKGLARLDVAAEAKIVGSRPKKGPMRLHWTKTGRNTGGGEKTGGGGSGATNKEKTDRKNLKGVRKMRQN